MAMKYTVHRKSLSEYESDIAGAVFYSKSDNESLKKLSMVFIRGGKIDKDLNDIDDGKLVNLMARRPWEEDDFDTDLEYLVATTTEQEPKPLVGMAYRLATYDTGIKKRTGFTGMSETPFRLYLLAHVDAQQPFDVWIEVTRTTTGWGGMKTVHGWRKTPRGGKR